MPSMCLMLYQPTELFLFYFPLEFYIFLVAHTATALGLQFIHIIHLLMLSNVCEYVHDCMYVCMLFEFMSDGSNSSSSNRFI